MERFSPTELTAVLSQIHDQAARVVSHTVIADMLERATKARPHEDAYIYKHMYDRAYAGLNDAVAAAIEWAGGSTLESPHKTSFQVDGTNIVVTVTHRTEAEAVYGVDVVYEIANRKVGLFQHKKLAADSTLKVDRPQLGKMRGVCGACPENIAPDVRRDMDVVMEKHFHVRNLYLTGYLKPACSAMYIIDDPESGQQGVLSACMLDKFKDSPMHVGSLVSLEAADEVFAKCLIGHQLVNTGELSNAIVRIAEADHDLVMSVFVDPHHNRQ